LITYKDLIATILQRQTSRQRTRAYESLLDSLIEGVRSNASFTDEWFVNAAGLQGKVVTGSARTQAVEFSDNVKSQAFITAALQGALRCPLCGGYLDPEKSVSYDHKERKRDGGTGEVGNVQMTHPYCNQGVNG
jgi:hypothetical protein